MKYSVVIRNRNEERYIGHCVQSVVDFLGDDVQIIIVDNESTDESIRIVNTFEYLDINHLSISKNEYTPGKSLNMGIERCDNEVTLVISAHCEIVSWTNWIPKTIKSLGAIWGKQIPIWDGKRVTPRYLWSNFGEKMVTNHWCKSEDRYFFHNAFSVFNTKHIQKYKFDERLSGKEDRYWATEQIDMGYDIVYNPEYIVKHHYTHNGATWKGVG